MRQIVVELIQNEIDILKYEADRMRQELEIDHFFEGSGIGPTTLFPSRSDNGNPRFSSADIRINQTLLQCAS
ncbi:MAG: hypothetical protein AABY87_00940 [bacterium]